MELDFSGLESLMSRKDKQAVPAKASETPVEARNLKKEVSNTSCVKVGALCGSEARWDGNLCRTAEAELDSIGKQIALLLKGEGIDEEAAKHYPDREWYVKQMIKGLQSRAAYLMGYLDERRKERQWQHGGVLSDGS